MPRTFRSVLNVAFATTFLCAALLLSMICPTRSLALADDERPPTPWLPTFVCPDRITLWDDIEQLEELTDPNVEVLNVKEWNLFFQASDGAEYGATSGSGPIVFDDRSGLREDVDYSFLLSYRVEARDKTTGETSEWLRNITYLRHTWPYCTGQIHSDYSFNERHYYFMSFNVWEGYDLTIPAGATLEMYQSGGEINLTHPNNSALVAGTLISATMIVSGNDVVLDGAHLQNNPNLNGRGLRIISGGSLQMTGGTLANTDITVMTGTVVLDRVTGSVDAALWPASNMRILNSTLQGSLYAKGSAALSMWNSTLTGSVRAGSGGAPGSPLSQATLISTTVLAPSGCYGRLVSSEKDGIVTLSRFLIDTRGQTSCSAVETYGGQTRLWNGSIRGEIRAQGDSRIEGYNLTWRAGRLLASGTARVEMAASRLESISNLYLYPGSRLTITDSSLVNTTLMLDGQTAGATLLRNDFTYTPNYYMLWLDRASVDLVSMHGNCFYCPSAIYAPNATGTLHLEQNYWGHALGPDFPPENVNPNGAEISFSGNATVLYKPFVSDEPAYCRQWPRSVSHLAQGIVGPDGGTVSAPGAMLVVPAGAFAQDAVVSWIQGEEVAMAAGATTPEAATLLARYELSAQSRTAPPQMLQFQKPVSLTLYYDEAVIGGAIESSLSLAQWSGSSWTPVAGTTVAAATDTLQALLPASGVYGLFGAIKWSYIYLPLCSKSSR